MSQNKNRNIKERLSGFGIYAVSILISLILLGYLGYHFYIGFSSNIETEYATSYTENKTLSFDAYIVRSEVVLNSTTTGSIGNYFTDGTKVRVGSEVAAIHSTSFVSASDRLTELDKQLKLLQDSSPDAGYSSSDTAVIDSRIKNYYYTIRENAEDGSYANLSRKRDELLTLLNKRMILTGKMSGYDGIIEKLENERTQLESEFGNVTETVTTPVSGYYYSSLDGYESIFDPDKLQGLTLEAAKKMISSEPCVYPETAIGKIATDFCWYILVPATSDDLRYLSQDSYYDVIFPFNDDTSVKMKLSSVISEFGSSEVVLIFETETIPSDFNFKRMQPAEVITETYRGFRVPVSAVRQLDGKQGVFILVGSVVDFRQIDVLFEFDGYYIVSAPSSGDPDYSSKLKLYDQIITSGKNLYVGKLIK